MKAFAAAGLAIALAAAGARASFEGELRPYDFDGDGSADLLFVGVPATPGYRLLRIVLGDAAGPSVRSAIFRTAGGSLRLADAGDIDGDGRDDLVLQGLPLGPSRGVIRIDLTDGATVIGNRFLPDGDGAWTVLGVGDTNGDGAQEILSESGPAIGQVRIQRPLPDGSFEQGMVPTAGGAWQLFGATDLDGDSREDLVFEGVDRTPAAGHLRIDFMATSGLSVQRRIFVASGEAGIDLRGVAPGIVVLEPTRYGDTYYRDGYRQFLRFDATGLVPGFHVFHFGVSAPFGEIQLPDFGAGDADADESLDWITFVGMRDIGSGEGISNDVSKSPICAVPGSGLTIWRTFAFADLDGDGTLDRAQSGQLSAPATVGSIRLFLHDRVGDPNCEWTRFFLPNGGGAWAPFVPSR